MKYLVLKMEFEGEFQPNNNLKVTLLCATIGDKEACKKYITAHPDEALDVVPIIEVKEFMES